MSSLATPTKPFCNGFGQALGEAAAARVAAAEAAQQAAAAAEAAAQLAAWDLRLLQRGLSSRWIADSSAAAVAQAVLGLFTHAGAASSCDFRAQYVICASSVGRDSGTLQKARCFPVKAGISSSSFLLCRGPAAARGTGGGGPAAAAVCSRGITGGSGPGAAIGAAAPAGATGRCGAFCCSGARHFAAAAAAAACAAGGQSGARC